MKSAATDGRADLRSLNKAPFLPRGNIFSNLGNGIRSPGSRSTYSPRLPIFRQWPRAAFVPITVAGRRELSTPFQMIRRRLR